VRQDHGGTIHTYEPFQSRSREKPDTPSLRGEIGREHCQQRQGRVCTIAILHCCTQERREAWQLSETNARSAKGTRRMGYCSQQTGAAPGEDRKNRKKKFGRGCRPRFSPKYYENNSKTLSREPPSSDYLKSQRGLPYLPQLCCCWVSGDSNSLSR